MLSEVQNPFPMPVHLPVIVPITLFHRYSSLHFKGVETDTKKLENLPQTMQDVAGPRTQWPQAEGCWEDRVSERWSDLPRFTVSDFGPLILWVPPLKLPWPWQRRCPFGPVSVRALSGSPSLMVSLSLVFPPLQLWHPVTFGCSHTFNFILKAQDFSNQESSLEECAAGSEGLSKKAFQHSKDSLGIEHLGAPGNSPSFLQSLPSPATLSCVLCKQRMEANRAGCQG